MSRVIKVGMIGAGGISQTHLKQLQRMEDVQITGVYDINHESAKQVAQNYRTMFFDDPNTLIHPKQVDAIFVCTPPFARSNYETLAAERGIHLFTEKPLGLHLEEVEKKLNIIQRSGIITSSGQSGRYGVLNEKAKQLLAGRQVDLIHLYRYHGLPPQPWLIKMDKSGGQMVDQTIHDIDAVRFIVGDFKEVNAYFSQRSLHHVNKEADIYDVGAVAFSLCTGAVGTVTTTNLLPQFPRQELTLISNNYSMIIDRRKKYILVAEGEHVQKHELKQDDSKFKQARTFIDAIQTRSQHLVRSNYEDAYKTLKVVLAMNESAKVGHPIQVS